VIEPLLKSNKRNLSAVASRQKRTVAGKEIPVLILNSQTNYVTRIDRYGNFSYVNPEFLKTFGYTSDELINHPFHTVIYAKDITQCQQVADACWQHPARYKNC